jgi:tetratricopeptide (TPR) repeat protein
MTTNPANRGSPAPVWNLTRDRNPNFTGRAEIIQELRQRMVDGQRVQTIHGLGGIGKSQTTVEYAYVHRNDYAIVWWIRADTPTSITAAYSRLAARLGKHLSVDAPPSLARDAVDALLDKKDALLILDSAAGPATIRPFLLSNHSTHVLINSRNANWTGVGFSHALKVFRRDESMDFLRRRTQHKDPDATVNRLANALGDLPLALEQAAACINQSGVSFSDYLTQFETQWAEMLLEGHRPPDYPYSVAMTWGLAFNAVEKASPSAAELLNLCSFLCADRVTLKILREGQDFLPERLQTLVTDIRRWNEAIAPLLDYSLVDADEQNFTVHRLVATVTRDRLDEDTQKNWCAAAIKFLCGSFSFNSAEVASWARCGELLPHIIEAAAHADRLKIVPQEIAGLLNDAGRYLLKRGQYAEAKAVLDRAMDIGIRHYGESHKKLSPIANNLGRAHNNLGDQAAAMQYFNQALSIDQAAYGKSHPHVAEVINNYGVTLHKTGDRKTARQQFEWAAGIYESHHGPDHPKLAHILNNLGYALISIGDIEAARPHLQRALGISEKTFGPEHPTTARILFNIATTLRSSGQLPAALQHLERALQIDETALGPTHRDVGNDCTALSDLLLQMGQRDASRNYRDRAQRIEKSAEQPPAPSPVDSLY